jgi:hypothetical protein
VGVRLSPFLDYMDCHDSNPEALAAHLVRELSAAGVLYCHMIEARMALVDGRRQIPHRLRPYREAFTGTFITAGGYDREEGNKVAGGMGKNERNGGGHFWRGKWRASRNGGWEGEFGGVCKMEACLEALLEIDFCTKPPNFGVEAHMEAPAGDALMRYNQLFDGGAYMV